MQEEKTYNISESGTGSAKSRYFIFTARETQNAKVSGREYKLLVPLNFVALKDNLKDNSNVQNAVRFTRSSKEMPTMPGDKILVMHLQNGKIAESVVPQNIQNFLKSVSMKAVILTWQAALDNLNREFERIYSNRYLIPTYAYERLPEFQRIEMSTVASRLGYEGTPIMPQDSQRLQNMNILHKELRVYWPDAFPNTVKRLQNLAILIESHVFVHANRVPNFPNSPQHRAVLLKLKDLFLAKKEELQGLMNYPDIMYQFMVNTKMIGLRVSANSIAVITSPGLSCRTPVPSASSAMKTVQPSSSSFPIIMSSAAGSSTSTNHLANGTWRPPTTTSTVHHFAQTTNAGQPSTVHHFGPSQSQANQSRSGVIVNSAGGAQFGGGQIPPNSVARSPLLKNILVQPRQPPTAGTTNQKLKTPFEIFAAMQVKKNPPGMPPLKMNNVQRAWMAQTPEVQQKYKMVADQLNRKIQAKVTNNIVLQTPSISSAATSKQVTSARSYLLTSWVCPFYPSHCSVAAPVEDTTALLRHLNNAHFSVVLETKLSSAQTASKVDKDTCPVYPCGYIGPTRAELIWHYSRCSAATAALLKEAAGSFGLTR